MAYFHDSVPVILKICLSTNKARFMFMGIIKWKHSMKLRLRIWFIQNWNVIAKKESEMKPTQKIFLTK